MNHAPALFVCGPVRDLSLWVIVVSHGRSGGEVFVVALVVVREASYLVEIVVRGKVEVKRLAWTYDVRPTLACGQLRPRHAIFAWACESVGGSL